MATCPEGTLFVAATGFGLVTVATAKAPGRTTCSAFLNPEQRLGLLWIVLGAQKGPSPGETEFTVL